MRKRALAVVGYPGTDLFYVIRRRSTQRWELPGGRIDAGESKKDAAKRETAEELGVQVRDGRKLFTMKTFRGGRRIAYSVYLFTDFTGLPHLAEQRVFDDVRLVSLADVKGLRKSKSLAKVIKRIRKELRKEHYARQSLPQHGYVEPVLSE